MVRLILRMVIYMTCTSAVYAVYATIDTSLKENAKPIEMVGDKNEQARFNF